MVPTDPSPGATPDVITGYQQLTLPANDDGTYPCTTTDDPPCTGSDTGPATVPLGFTVNFFGNTYDAVYVNNNGNVTFEAPLPKYQPSSLDTFGSPIIAPFFADIDTLDPSSAVVNFGTGTLNGNAVFVVNWPGVGCYEHVDTVLNDFQMIVVDRRDRATGTDGDDFDIEFNYNMIQWDTGQATSGDAACRNGQSGDSAYVGYTNGSNTGNSYQLEGSGVPNAFLDGGDDALASNSLGSTTAGRYVFAVGLGTPRVATTMSTTLSDGSQSSPTITVPRGTAVTDTATFTSAQPQGATGTITYTVYSDNACTQPLVQNDPQPITTPGTLPTSPAVTLENSGTYYWQAAYSGDGTDAPSTSACADEVETVTEPTPTESGGPPPPAPPPPVTPSPTVTPSPSASPSSTPSPTPSPTGSPSSSPPPPSTGTVFCPRYHRCSLTVGSEEAGEIAVIDARPGGATFIHASFGWARARVHPCTTPKYAVLTFSGNRAKVITFSWETDTPTERLCYGRSTKFVTGSGDRATFYNKVNREWEGVLPDCSDFHTKPCVRSRSFSDGVETAVIVTGRRDPHLVH